MDEIWKIIDEFTDYLVSTFGNIKNNKTGRDVKPSVRGGYYAVTLTVGYKKVDGKTRQITKTTNNHTLVAKAFIPNPEGKSTVNHKNFDKLNNHVDNLEWATMKEQNNHQRKASKEILALCGSRSVWRVDITTNEKIEKYDSIKQAAMWIKQEGLTKSDRPTIRPDSKSKCYGFLWIYDEPPSITNEEWRNVPSELIDGSINYEVSNMGRFKNPFGRIVNGHLATHGYLRVTVKNKHDYLLHIIVAGVFVPNSDPTYKTEVHHKNNIKSDCRAENLEWVSHSENVRYAHQDGLHHNTRAIGQYDKDMNLIQTFNSQLEAEKTLRISSCHISNCCNNKCNVRTVGGYIFKYLDDKTMYEPYVRGDRKNKKVIQYDLKMNKLREFKSQKDASEFTGIDASNMSKYCQGKKEHKLFIFKNE
jgi:predicted RNase H-related nuclease YkuK (DUF458 family)